MMVSNACATLKNKAEQYFLVSNDIAIRITTMWSLLKV